MKKSLVFLAIIALVFSPIVDIFIPYLPEEIADNFETKTAKAVNITDDIILFYNPASASSDTNTGWPSGGGTLSSDWTCISCSGGAYDNKFPVGSSSFGSSGSKTHSTGATLSNSNASAANASGGAGGNPSATAHNHGLSFTNGAASNYPQYGRLMMIKYTGVDPLTSLPDNVIAMFDAAPPAGWTTLTTWDDRVIIATNSTDGTGNSSDTHNHTLTWDALTAASETINEDTGAAVSNTAAHTHTAPSPSTTDTRSHIPQHASLIFATANGTVTDFSNVIAMFDATPDGAYWTSLSGSGEALENDFIEASTSYNAASGGSNTHTHANVTSGVSGQASADTVSTDNGSGSAEELHTHTITATMPASIANRPPYKGVIFAKCTTASCTSSSTIDISGTCKQADQSTDCTQGSKIAKVAVDGNLQAQTDTTIASGVWSITGVSQPSPNAIITVFIDTEGASTSQAVAVTKWTAGNITGVELIEGHLSIGSDQRNTITNANLSQYDNSVSGKNTFHDVNATVLTVDPDNAFSNEELYVKGGNTYQPNASGGDTINTHDVEINGTFDLDSNFVAASGSWDNNGYFMANTGSVSFTGIGSETISNVASASNWANGFYHLKIDSPGGTGTLTVGGDSYDNIASGQVTVATGDTLSISSGKKLTHTGSTLVLNGTISGAGRFVYRSATAFPTSGTVSSILVFDAQDGNQTMSQRTYGGQVEITNNSTTTARTVTMGAGSPYTFSSNLHVVASTSQNITLAGATNDPAVVDIAGDLDFTGTAGGSETITSGTGNWQVGGNVNFTAGTFTTETGNTLTMDGSGTLTTAANNLENVVLSGIITISNNSHDVFGNLDMTGGTITAGTSAVSMRGTSVSIIGGGNTLNDLSMGPDNSATLTMQTSNLTVAGTLTVVGATDKFRVESGRTLTLSGTGTPLSISGTFEPDDGSTVQYTGSTATVTGTTFGHLTLGGSGTYTLPNSSATIKGNLSVASGATIASGSATTLFRAGGVQSITDNTTNKQNLGEIAVRASTSGNTTLTLGSSIRVASISIDSSQTLDANGANTITISSISSPFTVNGIFAPRTGTVKYTGLTANVAPTKYASLSLAGPGTYTMPSTGTTTLLGHLIIANGATVASGSSTIFFRKGDSQSITDNNTIKRNLGEIAVQASTSGNTTLTLGSSIRIASATIDPSQIMDANGFNTLTVTASGSSFNASGSYGTFTRSTGVVVFTGEAATNIPTLDYYDLKLQPASSSAVTFTFLSGTSSISKTFTVGNGTTAAVIDANTNGTGLDVASVSISANATLTADNSSEFTVARHFRNSGTFTHSSGTVTFEDPNTSSISGATTFNNFTSTTAGKKIKFGAGQIFTFAGTFTITGASGNLIKLESTASASQWSAHFNSAQSAVTYAQITDSGCNGGTASVTLNSTSTDGGNNGTCWDFPEVEIIKPGGGPAMGGISGSVGSQGGGNPFGGGGPSGGNEGQSGSGGSQGGGESGGSGGSGASPVIFYWWY